MTDLLIFFVFMMFVIFGLTNPFVAAASYLWIDILSPQNFVFGFLAGKPLSMMAALLCLISFVINFGKLNRPANFKPIVFLWLFAFWITMTTMMSMFPIAAWPKWDWAFKSIIITTLLCFTIRNRIQLEFVLITFLAAASYYLVAAGIKSATGGGGYGVQLISRGNNSGITESSTLSMIGVLVIPLFLYAQRHALVLEKFRNVKMMWWGVYLVCIATMIGTRARTGLVALAVFIMFYIMKSKNKFRNLTGLAIVGVLALQFLVTDDYKNRMNTIKSAKTESSAQGRLMVWQWTIDFSLDNPLGGGFHAYLANAGIWQTYASPPIPGDTPKAFHNSFIEVLGEHGYPGLFLFCSVILMILKSNKHIVKTHPPGSWAAHFAESLNQAVIIFCVAGSFIGIAFQPFIYLLIVLSISLRTVVEKEKEQQTQ